VIVLVTAGTRDEASLNASEKKERDMRKRLYSLKQQWDRESSKAKKDTVQKAAPKKGQNSLADFA
jgi:ERCC4-related helicase